MTYVPTLLCGLMVNLRYIVKVEIRLHKLNRGRILFMLDAILKLVRIHSCILLRIDEMF